MKKEFTEEVSDYDMSDEYTGNNRLADKTFGRKRKVDRNKIRTMKHVIKLLDIFYDGTVQGFSDESWAEMTSAYNQISAFLTLEEHQKLGRLWSMTWSAPPDLVETDKLVKEIKNRIQSSEYFSLDSF